MNTETEVSNESEVPQFDNRLLALAQHLECDPSELSESRYDECMIEYGSQEYLVCTDDEADAKWDESLESYLDDCIMPEIKGTLANYFDRDAWKRDARFDGRGHALSSYDGNEYDVQVNGESFYIFRHN